MKDDDIYVIKYFNTIEFIIPRSKYHEYLGDARDDKRKKYIVVIEPYVPAMHIFYEGYRTPILPDGSDAEGPIWSTQDPTGQDVYDKEEIYEMIIDMLFAKLVEVKK